MAHIHCCTAVQGAGNSGVTTPTPSFPGFPAGATSGPYDVTVDMLQASSWDAGYVTHNGGTLTSAFAASQAADQPSSSSARACAAAKSSAPV